MIKTRRQEAIGWHQTEATVKSLLWLVIIVYLVSAVMLSVFQRKMLYFPQPAMSMLGEKNSRFTVNGVTLSGWVINPGQPEALIYYGGNAESIELTIPFFRFLTGLTRQMEWALPFPPLSERLTHVSVYLIPYRGYGDNPGHPTEQHLYRDAVALFDQIAPRHQSVSLMGRSLGSGVATYVAAARPVEHLVLVTPFDSIERVARDFYWMFPVSLLLKDKFASVARVEAITAPTTVIIAEHDQIISRARTDALITHFPLRQVAVFVIAGAEHNNLQLFPDYATAVISAFLSRT